MVLRAKFTSYLPFDLVLLIKFNLNLRSRNYGTILILFYVWNELQFNVEIARKLQISKKFHGPFR